MEESMEVIAQRIYIENNDLPSKVIAAMIEAASRVRAAEVGARAILEANEASIRAAQGMIE